MPFFTHNDVKKAQGDHIKNNITHGAIVIAPEKADDWATTQSRIIAQTVYSSTDVAVADSGDTVTITFNPKSGIDQTGTASSTDDICFVALDSTNSKVLYCTDLTDRDITNETGDTLDIPAIVHTINESVSA